MRTAKSQTVAIIQEVVPHYRVGVFERLAKRLDGGLTMYSADFAQPISGADCVRCSSVGIGNVRLFPRPLIGAILRKHSTIICEGRLGLLTCVLLAVLSRLSQTRVAWWTPLWRRNGRIEVGRGPRGWLMKYVLRSVSVVLTYGSRAAEVAAAVGIPSERVSVAYNSLDTPRLMREEQLWLSDPARLEAFAVSKDLSNKRIVLFVGQFIRRKRIDVLIDAFAALLARSTMRELCLVMVGGGPEVSRMRKRVAAMGLGSAARFEGEIVSINAITPYFMHARVLVLPGTGGLVINQAMTHGVPVIVGGGDGTEADSVVDGWNGYHWNGRDVEDLSQKIEWIACAEQPEWNRLSMAARSVVENKVNVDAMLDGIVKVLR